MITKMILKWNDEVYENLDYENDKHAGLKAFGCGVVEGMIDNAVLWGPVVFASCLYWKQQAEK
jgi:hypothetical protein